jgi:hypothetical protein
MSDSHCPSISLKSFLTFLTCRMDSPGDEENTAKNCLGYILFLLMKYIIFVHHFSQYKCCLYISAEESGREAGPRDNRAAALSDGGEWCRVQPALHWHLEHHRDSKVGYLQPPPTTSSSHHGTAPEYSRDHSYLQTPTI